MRRVIQSLSRLMFIPPSGLRPPSPASGGRIFSLASQPPENLVFIPLVGWRRIQCLFRLAAGGESSACPAWRLPENPVFVPLGGGCRRALYLSRLAALYFGRYPLISAHHRRSFRPVALVQPLVERRRRPFLMMAIVGVARTCRAALMRPSASLTTGNCQPCSRR